MIEEKSGQLHAYYGIVTSTFAGNSDTNVIVPTPTGCTKIIALIPIGYTPASSWATSLIFREVELSTQKIFMHTNGTTSQQYTIRYLLLYV